MYNTNVFADNPKLKNIFLAGFLFTLHVALTAYVNSSFLSRFLEERISGLVYTLGFAVTILTLLLIPTLLKRIGSHKFLLYAAGLSAVSLLLLSVLENIWLIILVFVFYLTLNMVIVFSLDELLEIFSKNSGIGKVRGLYIAILSGAWVLAQSISGTILDDFSFSALYFASSLLMILFFLVVFFFLRNLPDPDYDKETILASLKIFFRNKNLARAYKINFLLQFFFAFMVIYTPIYLHAHLGFSFGEIGIIFTIMLTPFVFLPFQLGKYSDKIGERDMLLAGFLIMSVFTLVIPFMAASSIFFWALILFSTRLGAATVEIMSDSYFFKHITPENDEFIGVYRNAQPMAYILAPIAAYFIFTFTPSFNFIYFALGACMLYGIYLASTIEKTDI